MRANRSSPLLILPALLLLSGCFGTVRGSWRVEATYSAPAEVIVSAPPPPLRVEVDVRPPPPHREAVWVDGYYKWEGRWVWEPGHWESGRPGYVWVAPVAREQGGRIVYHGGFWHRSGRPPPRHYSEPSTVVVAHPPRVLVRPAPEPEPRPAVIVRPAEPEPRPVVVVRPAEPQPPPRVVVRPAPEPQPPPRVVVRPAPEPQPPPRVVVRPAPEPQPPPRVVVRPAPEPQVNQADDRVARAVERPRAEGEGRVVIQPPRQPPRVEGRAPGVQPMPQPQPEPRPAVRDRNARVESPGPRPEVVGNAQLRVRPHEEPSARVESPREQPNPGQPRPRVSAHSEANAEVGSPREDPNGIRQAPSQQAITCRIDTPRAPEGGLVGITGTGFGASASARIGGRVAQIVERGQGRLVVRVPGSAGGGNVTVIEGDRTGNCGVLSVSSR